MSHLQISKDYPALNLFPYQQDHFQRVLEILSNSHFYVDGSEQSTGKTFIVAAVAMTLRLPVIVVCPVIAKHVWEEVLGRYGIPVYHIPETGGILSYEMLRSVKNHQPRHGLLTRTNQNNFEPTSLLNNIMKEGVLLVLDEFQKIKNQNAQSKSVRGLIKSLHQHRGVSKAAFLSGTPVDKEEQVTTFLRTLNFVTRRNLYSKIKGDIREEGIAELKDWSQKINPEGLAEFLQNNFMTPTREGATEYVYQMFIQVIRPQVMSIMPNVLNSMKDIKNGFYKMDPEDEREYQSAIQELSRVTGYVPLHKMASFTDVNIHLVNNSLIRTQLAKVNALVRICQKDLREKRSNSEGEPIYTKVAIFSYYIDVINLLMEKLAEFNPVKVNGTVSEENKRRNVQAFQEPTPDVRVFIGNHAVAGMAINLHDTTGRFPRKTYLLPDYRANELIQAGSRTTRPGVVETSSVRFFYGHSGMVEENIISALQKKGQVMREFTIEQTYSGAKFFDQFEDEYESD